VDAPPLGFEHLDVEAVELHVLAGRGHAPEVGQQEAADRLVAFRLDLDQTYLPRILADLEAALIRYPPRAG
jgi:hypothetical protein